MQRPRRPIPGTAIDPDVDFLHHERGTAHRRTTSAIASPTGNVRWPSAARSDPERLTVASIRPVHARSVRRCESAVDGDPIAAVQDPDR